MRPITRIRVFLSSPGDVADERRAARLVIDRLRTDPLVRDQIDLDVIAWDDADAATPMLATMTPQEAINRGLAKPSDCDIVIVIFWARMGTPLPPDYTKPDGGRYLSGTEWEYWDAVAASQKAADGLPLVVVYRRDGAPALVLDDPQFDDKREQWNRVQTFFAAFTNPDGSIRQGYNRHSSTDDFARQLEVHLKKLLKQVTEAYARRETPPTLATTETPPAPLWEGSPFPGLRAFTPADEPIYFGRGGETDALLARLREVRVVAVVGASGSGKSSLVGAGLLPRLTANSIEGSKDWLLPDVTEADGARTWRGLRFTPGEINDNPFDALAAKLAPLVGRVPREVAAELMANPAALLALLDTALASRPAWAEALLFVDQFEELYTLCAAHHRAPFVALLTAVAGAKRARAVLTLRADFFARCVEDPALAALLETGTLPLSAPTQALLYEMITLPAARAGLTFEGGLAARILADTGSDPGALALLAYALDQLYRRGADDGLLTGEEYEAIGGVQGAIGERAEAAFARLPDAAQGAFAAVFRELVEVDERGEPTRRRAALEPLAAEAGARALITALTDERLLVTSRAESGAVVEAAHEALLRSWDRLRLWIDEQVTDLQLRRRLEGEARAWAKADAAQRQYFVLLGSRLEEAERWAARFPAPAEVQTFIEASAAHREERIAAEERASRERAEVLERLERKVTDFVVDAQRSRRRSYVAAGIAAVIILLALVAGIWATGQVTAANTALGTVQAQGTQVAAQATYFGVEQARVGTLVAGVGMNPLAGATREPTAFLATLTQVAQLNAWQPVIEVFDGVEMVQVPPGCFIMGSAAINDAPPHEICFEQRFWIDRTEVTQAQFERFGGDKERPNVFEGDERPVDTITWFEARDFCARRAARLPTEAEWEYAARGPDSLSYPWGNTFVADNVVYFENSNNQTADVGSRPAGASWVGALDMSGNVREWVSSLYQPYPYNELGGREDMDNRADERVLRGGAWAGGSDGMRTQYRGRLPPSFVDTDFGFRCARSS